MEWQANPYSPVLFGAALTALVIVGLAGRRRSAPGAVPLGLLSLGIAVWCASYGLAWGLSATAAGQRAQDLSAVGAAAVPPAFLYFTLQISRRPTRWPRGLRAGLLGLFGLQTALIITNLGHWWHTDQTVTDVVNGVQITTHPEGPAYWLFAVVIAYGITALGTVVLAREFRQARGVYRAQYSWMLVGVAVSFTASIFTELGWTPWPGLDLAPIALVVTTLLVAYALFRHRLLDLAPVARTTLVDNMPDALVALDQLNRVIDINPAALRLLQWTGAPPLGQSAQRVFAIWPELMARYAEVFEAHAEIYPSASLALDMLITPLGTPAGETGGRLIVLRDISTLKQTERDLQHANDHLRAQLARIEDLQTQLREQALRDALTSLYNRRYLNETLPREIARAARSREALGLVLIDADHFKRINDTYGHAVGDQALREMANYLMTHSRAGDIVCRMGGEEVLVILPGAGLDTAWRRADQWRQGLAEIRLVVGERAAQFTISAGVASFPGHGPTSDDLLRAADQALYAAKAAGRNCVKAAPLAAEEPPAGA